VCQNYLAPETVEAVDWVGLKREEPNFIDDEFDEHFADLLYSAPVRGGESRSRVLILPEHKSQIDQSVLLQLGTYLMLAWRREWKDAGRPKVFRLSPPVLIVLYHGPKPWNGPRDFSDQVRTLPGMAHCVPHFGFTLIDLADTPVERIRGNPVTRAAFEAMKRASDGTLVEGLPSITRHFKELPSNRATWEWLRDVFLYARHVTRLPKKIVRESLRLIVPQNRVSAMEEYFLEKELDEAVGAAVAEAVAEAEARGEAKGKISLILTLLQRHFGEIPESVRERLTGIADLERLNELAIKAASAKSLDEFTRAL